mmetsp:Transcript_26039/g.71726  ORF Transcript_26039/g.71726 Transcript_26039/m.71726 type:complete len:81 (+) Transcript_26039:119-361(+)
MICCPTTKQQQCSSLYSVLHPAASGSNKQDTPTPEKPNTVPRVDTRPKHFFTVLAGADETNQPCWWPIRFLFGNEIRHVC